MESPALKSMDDLNYIGMDNGIEEMVREYTGTMSKLLLLERKLATELQKYVSWDIIDVSFAKGCIPVVCASKEDGSVSLHEFVSHIKIYGTMTRDRYKLLSCI